MKSSPILLAFVSTLGLAIHSVAQASANYECMVIRTTTRLDPDHGDVGYKTEQSEWFPVSKKEKEGPYKVHFLDKSFQPTEEAIIVDTGSRQDRWLGPVVEAHAQVKTGDTALTLGLVFPQEIPFAEMTQSLELSKRRYDLDLKCLAGD